MAATAAYSKKVSVATTLGGSYSELPATSASLSLGATVIDSTEMDTNDGYQGNILGLLNWSVSLECKFIAGHTGLGMVRTALTGRSALFVKYLLGNAGDGYKGPCVVENFNAQGEVNGEETVSISLKCNGALVADNAS